jgi:hypothetical protein
MRAAIGDGEEFAIHIEDADLAAGNFDDLALSRRDLFCRCDNMAAHLS